MCRQGGSKCELDVYQRYNNTRCVFSRGCALFGAHVDDEQVPKISSEISPHINDKQLGRLNSYKKNGSPIRFLAKFAFVMYLTRVFCESTQSFEYSGG